MGCSLTPVGTPLGTNCYNSGKNMMYLDRSNKGHLTIAQPFKPTHVSYSTRENPKVIEWIGIVGVDAILVRKPDGSLKTIGGRAFESIFRIMHKWEKQYYEYYGVNFLRGGNSTRGVGLERIGTDPSHCYGPESLWEKNYYWYDSKDWTGVSVTEKTMSDKSVVKELDLSRDVETNDGFVARVICSDARTCGGQERIIALVKNTPDNEIIGVFDKQGNYVFGNVNHDVLKSGLRNKEYTMLEIERVIQAELYQNASPSYMSRHISAALKKKVMLKV